MKITYEGAPISKIDKLRRNITKAVWATPVISAVTLPAHAQTSPGETTQAPGETTQAPGETTQAPGETTQAPNCTNSVNVNIVIDRNAEINIGIDGINCTLIRSGGAYRITVTRNNLGIDVFTPDANISGLFLNSEIIFTRITDSIGRLWTGELTYSHEVLTQNVEVLVIDGTLTV